jgi:hypothetical protein
MLITKKRWGEIGYLFSEIEKQELTAAISGEVICPPGFHLNKKIINQNLLAKLESLIKLGKP